MLEKATRVLSDEDRIMMDREFVGKNGEKRKIEVRPMLPLDCMDTKSLLCGCLPAANHRAPKTEEEFAIRD
jgi:elongation factor 3